MTAKQHIWSVSLNTWIIQNEISTNVLTDISTPLVSGFWDTAGFWTNHITMTANHLQTNGQVERFFKRIISGYDIIWRSNKGTGSFMCRRWRMHIAPRFKALIFYQVEDWILSEIPLPWKIQRSAALPTAIAETTTPYALQAQHNYNIYWR